MRLNITGFLFLTLFAPSFTARSVQPYEPTIQASIEDRWRWIEQENLSGLNLVRAAKGANEDLWFSRKEGVVRYDGRALEYFDFEGIEIHVPIDLHVAKNGAVFLFSRNSLLALEDSRWELLASFSDEEDITRGSICEAANGDIWVGAGSKLLRYSEGSLSSFETGFTAIDSALIDGNGRLWISERTTADIAVYDLANTRMGELALSHQFKGSGSNEIPTKLYLDSKGRVWVLDIDDNDGCYLYENYEKTLAVEGLRNAQLWTNRLSIAEQPEGRFWFSVSRRLGEFNSGELKVYDLEEYPLPTSDTYILGLNDKRLFIGGKHSIPFIIDLSTDRWARFDGLNFQCETGDARHWYLDHSGRVVTHQTETGVWLFQDDSDGIIDTPNKIIPSSDGTVWVSGKHEDEAAVSYFENGVWKRKAFPEVGKIFSHLAAIETSDGAVLFGGGTEYIDMGKSVGGGVVFRIVNGQFRALHLGPPDFLERTANLVERKNDGLWLGAASLVHRQGFWGIGSVSTKFFEHEWIDHMITDRSNDLWVAYWGTGLYQYKDEEWILHSESSGLGSNQVVFLLDGQYQKGIWAATAIGLSRYDGQQWSNWKFPPDTAFQRENNTLFESSDGSLWINYAYRSWLLRGEYDSDKRDRFRSLRYRADADPPETHLTLFTEETPEGGQSSFAWTGNDLWSDTPASELEYSWRLDDQPWSEFSRTTNITLNHIRGGQHHFEVRARDRDWNVDPTPAFVSIQIVPPLWKQPWFVAAILVALSIIALLVYTLFKVRIKSALALEELRLNFFTSISHELRNPLSVIIGPLESLLRKEVSKETRTSLQIALRNARKMQGLVNQLLQFRSMELGMSAYNPSKGEVTGFVREAVEAHGPLWEAKRQSVSIITDPAYLNCSFDADKLQKIVDNLITNAIKYTEEGGTIQVRFSVTSNDDETQACLVVEDDGVGIPAHEIDLVFKPFYRVRNVKTSDEGFGIGLALVGQLVQLWGGEHQLESPVLPNGKGTRVTIRLPLEEKAEDSLIDVESVDENFAEDEKPSGELKRPTVLLVEDNEDLRYFLKSELQENYQILEARDGREGFEMALKSNPDMVISDVMMPEIDGIELCKKIHHHPATSHIPIILLTAKGSEESKIQGIESGADAYLAKPLNMLRLMVQIDNLLEGRRSLKEKFSKQLNIEPKEITVSSTDENILRKAIEIVETHMKDERFNTDQFAQAMAMSRATLYRKIKAITGESPTTFIRTMRLKRAAQLLKSGKVTVSETLDHIGIFDLSYFSRIFKKKFGVSPTKYLASDRLATKPRS